jgi:aspartate-semialdehyde dehydrogenase
MDEDVPLVIPEINADDVKWHKGFISNPNCATIIGLVPLWPLHQAAGLQRIIASTYQAASGAGKPGLDELVRELACVAAGEPVGETKPFAYQLAANLIPQISGFKEEAYTDEDIEEFRHILYTMKSEEVDTWVHCLQTRGIEIPQAVKDEILLMLQ